MTFTRFCVIIGTMLLCECYMRQYAKPADERRNTRMKTKPIAICFGVFTALATVFRLFELLYCIDPATGFYLPGKRFFCVFAIICAAALFAACAVLTAREPAIRGAGSEQPPALVFAAAVCFLGFFVDLAFRLTSETRISSLRFICTALILAFFLAEVWCGIAGTELHPAMSFLPLPYWLYALVRFFIDISDMAVISENLYRIAALSLMLLCFTSAAKLHCRVETGVNTKRLTCLGLTACAVVSAGTLSEYAAMIIGRADVLHYGEPPEITLPLAALYLAVFVFCRRSSPRWQSENSENSIPRES